MSPDVANSIQFRKLTEAKIRFETIVSARVGSFLIAHNHIVGEAIRQTRTMRGLALFRPLNVLTLVGSVPETSESRAFRT